MRGADLSVCVLGPLEVRRGGQLLALGPSRQQLVLGLLLLAQGRPVSRERLVDVLWSDPPRNAVNKLQGYVAALRAILEPDRPPRTASILCAVGGGYRLDLPAADLAAFDRAVHASTELSGTAAVDQLRAGLTCWRGTVLENLGSLVEDLPEVRAVQFRHREAALRAGRMAEGAPDAEVLAGLRQAAANAPFDEDVHAELMRALARSGLPAEAHAVYRDLRRRLVEELGLEPGERLRHAQQELLQEEPEPVRAAIVPAQLPPAAAGFVGREALVATMSKRLADPAAPSRIGLICGVGGSGKTTAAIHIAHRLRPDFPDGQLFAVLREAGDCAVPAEQILADFLVGLGVPAREVPASPAQRSGLYRSLLAQRRILIVLDDVLSAGQVRPLLPGTPHSAVLMTSRSRLATVDIDERQSLGAFDPPESREYLRIRLAGAAPQAVTQLAAACGHLPLALRVVAARSADRPDRPITELAAELTEERRRLDGLALEDLQVRASLAVSYRTLSAPAATAFRRWTLAAGPAIPVDAAAVMLDEPDRLHPALTELADAHLVTIEPDRRLVVHDLLQAFGRELAEAHDPAAVRTTAVGRLAGWYGTSLRHAVQLNFPAAPIADLHLPAATSARTFDDAAAALRWLDTERDNLLGSVTAAARYAAFPPGTLAELCAHFGYYADRAGQYDPLNRLTEVAARYAREQQDQRAEARAVMTIAAVAFRRNELDRAAALLQTAADCFAGSGDAAEASALQNLALVQSARNQAASAIPGLRRAIEIRRAYADPYRLAGSVSTLGSLCLEVGDLAEAATLLREGRDLAEGLDAPDLLAIACNNLGEYHRSVGDRAEAERCFGRALQIAEETGTLRTQALARAGLGRLRLRADDRPAALELLRRAARDLAELGDEAARAAVLSTLRSALRS